MKRKTTIRDIARVAQVSVATVSAVVNNKTDHIRVSDETRQRVLQVCRDLDYTPNVHARRLASDRAEAVVFLTPPPDKTRVMSLFGQMLMGIQEEISKRRYGLFLEVATQEFLQERRYLKWFSNKSADGVICWGLDEMHPIVQDLAGTSLPVILIGFPSSSPGISYVKGDDYDGARQAVRLLYEQGYRAIAHISAPMGSCIGRERYMGYRKEMEVLGMSMPGGYLRFGDFTEPSGYACMKELLALDCIPDAVFAGNDYMAYGAMQALEEAGLRIPDDIAFVGADDSELARLVRPRLTSIRLPMYGMGIRAAQRLFQMIESPTDEVGGDVLPEELVMRESSGPKRSFKQALRCRS